MTTVLCLHPLLDFIPSEVVVSQSPATYWYEGRCPQAGHWLRLPRTALAEAIAHGLMQFLAADRRYAHEGKMYGVLLVATPEGELRVIKAFSGLLNGESTVPGWVPSIPGRELVALEEAHTLARLEAIKQELLQLQRLPERQEYNALSETFEQRLQELNSCHQQHKQKRQQQRQIFLGTLNDEALAIALEQLDDQSRKDGIERRHLKRQRDRLLQPLKLVIDQADDRIRALKQQRKQLSRQLQAQMHTAYWLTNFAGDSLSLQQLMPRGAIPTGTGDCCAPKLLHYAAIHHLQPLAMAEFWWGGASSNGDKVQGEFYEACVERCQPLMGFLLSGLPTRTAIAVDSSQRSLPIVYEDEWLIAVDKPAGLLSVPGRYRDRQDSVLSRLQNLLPDGMALQAVHRLDQETSGILLLARDAQTYRQLSQQFQQRQVHKVYEAVLAGLITREQGVIDLPLWGDPSDRPRQQVNWDYGKPSLTHFQVITKTANQTRIEFVPVTGRTHQLRVHAADPQGLGVPILGDRLYGCSAESDRLHLHAREIRFEHPRSGKALHLKAKIPF